MSVEREMSLAEWCAKLPSQHVVNRELATLTKQLAALAEQNEKLREALKEANSECDFPNTVYVITDDALSLPDLASPVLNRIRAEGMRMAAEICEGHSITSWFQCMEAIRARAAELEKSNG